MKYEDWYLATHKDQCETVWGFLHILRLIGVYSGDGVDARDISHMFARAGK